MTNIINPVALSFSVIIFLIESLVEDSLTNMLFGIVYSSAESVETYSPMTGALLRFIPPVFVACTAYAGIAGLLTLFHRD